MLFVMSFFGCYCDSLHLCHHKLRTQIFDYQYFRVASNFLINWLKLAEGVLYKANILKLDDLVSSLTARTSKVCSVQ
jgi:hypothetical protein